LKSSIMLELSTLRGRPPHSFRKWITCYHDLKIKPLSLLKFMGWSWIKIPSLTTKWMNRGCLHSMLWAGQSGDQIRVGVRFFAPVQIAPGYSSPGVAQTTHTDIKKRVELFLYSPSGLSWPVLG
jgi:hypothetical protein